MIMYFIERKRKLKERQYHCPCGVCIILCNIFLQSDHCMANALARRLSVNVLVLHRTCSFKRTRTVQTNPCACVEPCQFHKYHNISYLQRRQDEQFLLRVTLRAMLMWEFCLSHSGGRLLKYCAKSKQCSQ